MQQLKVSKENSCTIELESRSKSSI